MPVFIYRARDRTGRLIEGSLEADSERGVVVQLRERGYIATTLREKVTAPSIGEQVRALSTVPRQDLVLFTRQLATMVGAGLPLVSALDVAARQADSRRLREVLDEVREGIDAGGSLSGEMAKHPLAFSDLYVNTVHAGEVSGALDRVLAYLADYLERELELIQRIKTTALYPSIVLTAAGLVGLFAVFVVLPQLVSLFAGLKVALPWPTRVLIFASTTGQRFWYVILMVPLTLILTAVALSRAKAGRMFLDRVLIRMPIVGRLVLKLSLARFARMFAMVTRSGVPLVEGMEVVARSTGNAVVASAVEQASRSVREGRSIADALSQSPLFPPMVWRMVTVGEQTGALEQVLDKIADFYDREVDHMVQRFAAIIEPIMIVGVGGVVAFVAVAMLLPLWRLIGTVR